MRKQIIRRRSGISDGSPKDGTAMQSNTFMGLVSADLSWLTAGDRKRLIEAFLLDREVCRDRRVYLTCTVCEVLEFLLAEVPCSSESEGVL